MLLLLLVDEKAYCLLFLSAFSLAIVGLARLMLVTLWYDILDLGS